MNATGEVVEVLKIKADARRIERERIVLAFRVLAQQFDEMSRRSYDDAGLAWSSAASSVRRVCKDVCHV